jgi:hypothetical protein
LWKKYILNTEKKDGNKINLTEVKFADARWDIFALESCPIASHDVCGEEPSRSTELKLSRYTPRRGLGGEEV